MARLPGPQDLGQRPTPQVAGGIASYRGDIPGAEAPGEAVMTMGRAVAALGEDFKREMDRADTLRAEEAFTKLREKQLDLTIGPENGYENLKGSAATNRPIMGEWSAKLDAAAKEIADGLGNDNQRRLFAPRVGVSMLQYKEGILRYTVKQSDVQAQEVYDGTMDTEVRQATANWNDPAAVDISVKRIEEQVNSMGARKHWPKQFRDSQFQKEMGKINSAVIGQAIAAGDYEYAQEWYRVHREDVDAATAKQLGNAVREGTQKQLTADYTSSFLAARDNSKALNELDKLVSGDQRLDDTRKNALIGRIQSRTEVLANRAERDQARRERAMERQINTVNAITLAGFEPTMEQLAPLIAAARGTGMEGQVTQMINVANATRQFRLSSPQQQEQYLTQMEAQARKDPSKFDVTAINRFKTIYQNQQAAVKEDPTSFAVRQGLVDIKDPAAAPLDLSKPDTLAPQLQARFDLSRAVSARYGAPFKPLTKEETDLMIATLKTANTEQKRSWFGAMANSAGSDFAGYKAIMAQIAPDDPVTAMAGIAAGRGRQTTDMGMATEPGKATIVADLILRGQAALRPRTGADGKPDQGKLWPMPPATELRKLWQSTERDAFQGMPEARNGYYQTAEAIYAGLSIEAGDASGVVDSRRWDNAIKLSTGGIERYNGRQIILPWGQDYGRFRDGLNRRIEDIASTDRLAEGTTVGRLKSMPLEVVGDGKYVLRAGDGILVDKANKPIVIDFNEPVMFRPSGYGKEPGKEAETGKVGLRYGGSLPAPRAKPDYGTRADGTAKGDGFLGKLQRPDGTGVSTEISIGVNIGGKEMEIPALVPTLTKGEISTLLTMDLEKDRIPEPIKNKAVAHARKRIAEGKSPFYDKGEGR